MSLSLYVVIPARGGSTRVPRKNIRPLGSKPLLSYTLELVQNAGLAKRSLVSSDDEAILEVARQAGIRALKRPPELATASASTEVVLLHALDTLETEGERPEWLMTLPPTSPFRSVETVLSAVREVEDQPDSQDCLMTVSEDRGDFWRQTDDGELRRLFPDAPRRQQDREPLFEENSALYLSRVSTLRETGSILGRRVRGLAIDPTEAWDINTETDFALAEALLGLREKDRGG